MPDAILTEALPTDQESRTFSTVYASYAALALTDRTFSVKSLVSSSDTIEDVIASQLRAAQETGQMPGHLDAGAEATSLLAMSAGLGTSVLAGQRTADDALRVLRYQLDRLLPAASPMTPQ